MFWNRVTPEIEERGVREREHARQLELECTSVRFGYVSVELDVAITFCEEAASAVDIPAKNHALEAASKAYLTAQQYKNDIEFTEEMQAEIEKRELRLNSLLVVTRSTSCDEQPTITTAK